MTDNHFGFTREQWEAMVDAGLTHLETLASRGGHTDYSSFCRSVRQAVGHSPSPGDHSLKALLRDVARRSYDSRGVIVTVLVHYKDGGMSPGSGFYAISQELGLLPKGSLDEDQKLVFLADHVLAVESAYRRPRRRRGGPGSPVENGS